MSVTNQQIAAIFQQMADILSILDGDHFRILSFQKSARIIEELVDDLASIGPDEKMLAGIQGIGKGTAQRIAEFLRTGQIKDHQDLLAQIPPGLPALLGISGMGPKTVALLWREAGVDSIDTLKSKLESDGLTGIKGLGPKKIENLKQSLTFAASSETKRRRLGDALMLANWFLTELRKMPGVKDANYAGSLRRGKETIGDIDLLVAADDKHAQAISDAFVKLDLVETILAQGKTKSSVRVAPTAGGMQVDLRVLEPESYGAALLYFTGSKEHNVRLRELAIKQGMKLNEYALTRDDKPVASKTETDIYRALGLDYIPPELREDHGEIALATEGKLPELVRVEDIAAELHCHTDASDGSLTILEMAMLAIERGFHTIAITDHSKSQTVANGLSEERLEQHILAVREVAKQLKGRINLLVGSEVDILADGKLDYSNSLLKELDIVVASPHHALNQDPAKATKRLLKAIENPYVSIIGHPTGRIINRRPGLSPDMKQLFHAAAQRGVALEINANHYRLDLRDTHARAAIEAGVKLAIDTDAHGVSDFDQLIYGVLTARRAGATKADVVNCMSADALKKWIASTRK